MRIKQINLLPTEFILDVLVYNSIDELLEYYLREYNVKSAPSIRTPTVDVIESSESSIRGGMVLIVASFPLEQMTSANVAHEANHILDYLSQLSGVEINNQATEWKSYMIGYIVGQIQMMKQCSCPDGVEMGSYSESIAAPLWWNKNKKVNIDKCIYDEIMFLWSKKIYTSGCCCGHNQQAPMINVEVKSNDDMIKLGYKFTIAQSGTRCYIPKSVGFDI